MQNIRLASRVLVIVGGLNWGLVAIADFDLVAWIFGETFGTTNAASRIVYGLVGLASLVTIGSLFGDRRQVAGSRAAAPSH